MQWCVQAAPSPGGRRRSSAGSEDLEAVAGGLRRLQALQAARDSPQQAAPQSGPQGARASRSRSASADHSQTAGAQRTNGE